MSRFFIDRPIFAWVIAIIIMLAGVLSIFSMPVAQYPSIAPPLIAVTANYPGASAKTAEDSVTQIIEQQMKGLDGLMYMTSTSSSDGSISVSLSFKSGTNADIAQVQVQNKLQAAMALLPQEVQRQGVTVNKSARNFMVVYGFVSKDGSMNRNDISDYMVSNIVDPISRVKGVGDIQVFGAPYAMRIWLDPSKLLNYKLTPADIISAIQAQNAQVSAGQLGGLPAVKGQALNATVTAQSRLQTPEQFQQIFLKTNTDGSQVRLKDVARVEIGAQNYAIDSYYNGKPASALAIKLAAGANALDTATAVNAKIKELEKNYPPGLETILPYDTTPFVKLSIEDVVKTLIEAIILVFLVMYLFLQSWRATLIPTIAVPVVILGTFAIINVLGFSINTLTMFAMVLAIGLLVDDAIVVVENVERVMHEEKLPPKEATKRSMTQITGALIGITSVLSAVFIPMAFFGGSTGVIYRQFSVTLVSAMVLSVTVALILTPALCGSMLKAADGEHQEKKGFFGWFNRMFQRNSERYQNGVAAIMKRSALLGIAYIAVIVVLGFVFSKLPSSFLPEEDQGVLFAMVQLPAGATQERTEQTLNQVRDYFLTKEKDNVEGVFTVAGFSFAGAGQNAGLAFVRLKDWSERTHKDQKAAAIAGRAMGAFSQFKDGMAFAFTPPAVMEMGTAGGFDLQLQDTGGVGHEKLIEARNMLLGMASQNKSVMGVRPNGQEDTPQYKVNVDYAKAGAMGISTASINALLSTAWGSSYADDFVDRGRVKKVYVQGESDSRMAPEDLNKWYVRNNSGDMISLASFATGNWSFGSPRLERYNGMSSVNIQGNPAPGKSTGQAMAAMEQMIAKLPAGIGYEWTGMSLEEKTSGKQAPMLYGLAILVVFLCLAALYESWSVPFAVMMVVPLGVFGAVMFTRFENLNNDIYFQVGMLAVIGLSAKNAILIIEFAKELREDHGESLVNAILHAVRMRLRPIIMTSLAFGLGVVPLVLSNGAGAGSQNAVGTGVLGGVVSATFLGIFFIPVFYFWISSLFKEQPKQPAKSVSHDVQEP